jgi:transcriptional regulator with XRE-family HTH domain
MWLWIYKVRCDKWGKCAKLASSAMLDRGLALLELTMSQDLNSDLVVERIKQKMAEHGMKQATLAKEAGVTPAALSQILNKERSPSTSVLVKLANTLDVSVDFLLGRTATTDVTSVLSNSEVLNFYQSFSSLSKTHKSQIMDMVAFLKQRQK